MVKKTISQLPDGSSIRDDTADFAFEQGNVTYNDLTYSLLNVGSQIIQISSDAELQARPEVAANVFTCTQNTTIVYTEEISSNVRFETAGFVLQFWNIMQNVTWTYTGGGIFQSGQGSVRFRESSRFDGDGTGTLLNKFNSTFNVGATRLSNWASGGTLDQGVFLFRFTSHVNFADTFTLKNIRSFDINGVTISGFAENENVFTWEGQDVPAVGGITNVRGTIPSTSRLVNISPSVHPDSGINLHANPVLSGGLFDNTVLKSGDFTAVANASFSGINITSVTDDGGRAKFNFAGQPVFAGQIVTTIGFSESTYNFTRTITETDESTYFIIEDIEYVSDVTGTFSSDSVTFTDTITPIVELDDILITTDSGISYDGGSTAYNKQTNSFQVNFPFVATESGTWEQRGLDEKDNRVIAVDNSGYPSSMTQAEGRSNDVIEVLGSGGYQPVQDLTPEIGDFSQDVATQSFKIDEATGAAIFTGGQPVTVSISYQLTAAPSAGNAQVLDCAIHINGTIQPKTTINIDTSVTGIGSYIGGIFTVNPGDVIQLYRDNLTNTTNTDVEAYTLLITGQ